MTNCTYRHPDFGYCDGAMVYGAVWTDESGWVPVDFLCPSCNGGRTLR